MNATLWLGVALIIVPTAIVLLVPEVRSLRSRAPTPFPSPSPPERCIPRSAGRCRYAAVETISSVRLPAMMLWPQVFTPSLPCAAARTAASLVNREGVCL